MLREKLKMKWITEGDASSNFFILNLVTGDLDISSQD